MTMSRTDAIDRLKQNAAEIRRRFGVRELSVFGSVARDEAGDTSDVDVLVTFEGTADFDRFMDLRFYLEDLLGRRIDLVTDQALRQEMREQVEREAVHVT